MTGWPLRRMLAAVVVGLGIVLVVAVLLIGSALVRLDHARSDRVDRFGPALLATESLAKSYSDQETGVRGYASSGDPRFLAPYRSGRITERDQTKDLGRLLAGRSDLRARLADVSSAAHSWQREVAEPAIERTRVNGPDASTQAAILAGKDRFDAVRVALHGLRKPVREARDVSSRMLDQALMQLRVVLAGCLVLLIAVAAAAWVALRRSVTDPLGRLRREVERVEGGDLSHAVVVDAAPEEIRSLAEQVDAMRIRIVHEFALAQQARDDAQSAQALVEEQAENLARSNTELEQFAYVASHDLQEPLRKVASFCQLLERRYKGQLDDRGDQYIEFAVDGAKRMQQLINDLLAFSRVGRLTSDFAPVDLGEALAQAERQIATTIEDSGAVVTHDELPTVLGEGLLLVQVFQNLIANGVKFRGEASPCVHIGVGRVDDMWELSCSDNGIGIEGQYADKIFLIFQRLHGRDVYGGTGIGLAMCKKIVEYHGGQMWLDTSVTDGATFRWTLPAVQVSDTKLSDTEVSDTDVDEGDNERMSDGAVSAGATD
jgi:signal transduction histidine kinase